MHCHKDGNCLRRDSIDTHKTLVIRPSARGPSIALQCSDIGSHRTGGLIRVSAIAIFRRRPERLIQKLGRTREASRKWSRESPNLSRGGKMKTKQFIGSVLVAFAGLLVSSSAWCAGGVSGKVTVTGQVSKPKPINMSSEPDCAKQYSAPPTSEDVVAGASGALKNVVVYISAGGSDETAPAQPVNMTQK